MLSILFVAALLIVFAGIGYPIVSACDRACQLHPAERWALSASFGPLAVYAGVFAIGSLRLDSVSMWALTVVLTCAALPGLIHMPYRRLFADMAIGLRVGGLWTQALAAAVLVVGLSSLIQGLAPPSDFDSLMYHLALPRFDVEAGRLSIPWDRALPHVFFPALGGHLSRFALTIATDGVAQMLHGAIGLLAAVAIALVVRRHGRGLNLALGAALFFLSIRVVVWEMATVEVDLTLAAYFSLALLAYTAWRTQPQTGLAILFGAMLGAGFLVKYHGILVALSFAPLIIHDVAWRRLRWIDIFLVAPLTVLLLALPHMVRDVVYTGNPVFPLLNPIFNPGAPDPFEGLAAAFGTGRGLADLLTTPWTIFVLPMRYFDGMIFGAPYILAFAPLVLLSPSRARSWAAMGTVAVAYYVLWFYFVGQQVRFLLPAMPIMAAIAAGGVAEAWRWLGSRFWRGAFVVVSVILGVNQGMFVAAYAGVRLPAAIGMKSARDFLMNTPTIEGAFFDSCTFIRANLKRGERYFSLTVPHSYYCPQISATSNYFPDEEKWWLDSNRPPELSLIELIRHLEVANFRFVLVPTRWESRRNETAALQQGNYDWSGHRLGRYLGPALQTISPLFDGQGTAVYDGSAVLASLRALRGPGS